MAGAISSRGGRAISAESQAWVRKHGRVKTGNVAYTSGGNLPCDYVIHAVGPIWRAKDPKMDQKLASSIQNSLLCADKLQLTSISFPAISSGIFGFPKERCALIFMHVIK